MNLMVLVNVRVYSISTACGLFNGRMSRVSSEAESLWQRSQTKSVHCRLVLSRNIIIALKPLRLFSPIKAYAQDKSLVVKYSGHVVQMQHDYPAVLSKIQTKVEEQVGVEFNHVMLNRYDSGNEYIGKHRDTKENKVRSL